MYRAVALPIIVYGAAFWHDKAMHTLVLRNLLAAQRSLLLAITGACRTSSTSSMQILSGELPMDLAVVQAGLIGLVRRNYSTKWNEYEFNRREETEQDYMTQEAERIKNEITKEWQRRWDADEHGRWTHKMIPNVTFARDHQWFNPGRRQIYMLTGYGPMNGTLYRRGAVLDPGCIFCDEEETAEHMLLHCKEYEEERRESGLQLQDGEDMQRIIRDERGFYRFQGLTNMILEKRNSYLKMLDSEDPPPRGRDGQRRGLEDPGG